MLLFLGQAAAIVKRDLEESSSRMNFAAQLLYSSYLSERLQRLYSPRPALKDTEENDPFWQRCGTTLVVTRNSCFFGVFFIFT